MLRLTLATLTWLALALPLTAQEQATPPSPAEIDAAWQAGDFVTARDGLAQLVDTSDDVAVLYRYGLALAEGRGGPVDLGAALGWLEKAAAQDHAPAKLLLARLLLSLPDVSPGQDYDGPGRDASRAAGLLTAASGQGLAEAQYYLGLLYLGGDGVTADAAQAADWLRSAAAQGFAPAQFELYRVLSAPGAAPQEPGEALLWLGRAAAAGMADAQYLLAQAKFAGQKTPEASGPGMTWLRRAAEAGNVIAQRDLGTRYLQGQDVDANGAEALRWLRAAASAGDAGAMSNLGFAYLTGQAGEQSDALAVEWYQRASDKGLARAHVVLAGLKAAGRGTRPDPGVALTLYSSALGTDSDDSARVGLGQLVMTGQVDRWVTPAQAVPWVMSAAQSPRAELRAAAEAWLTAQADLGLISARAALALVLLADPDRQDAAMTLLQSAAEAGEPAAQFALGRRFMTGEGVPLDYVSAHGWFNIAAALGHPEAADLRGTPSPAW